jgi:hypothetical protein
MKKSTFKSYKEEILKRYSIAKIEDTSGILVMPTPAQLRDFCSLKCDKGLSAADEELMKVFFETQPDEKLKRSIERCNIDKFKPIISFLKGEKDTENQIRVGLAAIIVDFKPRPYSLFLGKERVENSLESKPQKIKDFKTQSFTVNDNIKSFSSNSWLYFSGIALVTFCLGLIVRSYVLPEKQCMQWQNDHYEKIDCQSETNNLYSSSSIIPFDESSWTLKKLTVTDTTTFFNGDKAIIWYSKVNGYPEFFNGPGFHPLTGKGLRPVSEYIIEKYVKNASNPNTTP